MRKMLLVIAVLCLASCDYKMKECSYDVYQQGKKVPGVYRKYISPSKWCESFSKDGVVYKLKSVDMVKVRDIKK